MPVYEVWDRNISSGEQLHLPFKVEECLVGDVNSRMKLNIDISLVCFGLGGRKGRAISSFSEALGSSLT